MRLFQTGVAALLALGLFSTGCGVKEYLNCREICEKKRTCGTDSNYDVGHCVDVCSDTADRNQDFARRVDSCKECVGSLSCNDWKNMLSCYPVCPALP